MDVCKIGGKLYQYTAIDDCSRFKVVELFPRRTPTNTLRFLETVIEQEKRMEYGIKFRPIKPRSPYLNGKVEKSQRTDLDEFYSTVDIRIRTCLICFHNGNFTIIGLGHTAL